MLKFEYVIVHENIPYKFDNGHCRIKVKVMVGLSNFSPFTTIQTVRPYSNLVEASKLKLSMYVHLIIIHTTCTCIIDEYPHASMISQIPRACREC